jgi:hypothetical protein
LQQVVEAAGPNPVVVLLPEEEGRVVFVDEDVRVYDVALQDGLRRGVERPVRA